MKEGTPQGGPLSPLLANIYLDALDKELDERGHSYCRYADDGNINVSSQAAERTLASIQDWIEKHLRLPVNEAKSGVGRVWERKFLGFRLSRQVRIGIAPEVSNDSKRKYGNCGVATRVAPVKNCAMSGCNICAAGGVTSNWLRTAPLSSGWRAGCDGTSGNASGYAGMMRQGGKMLCGVWGWWDADSKRLSPAVALGI